MSVELKKTIILFFLLGIAFFAYYLQTVLVFSGDIDYLLHVSNQLLEGGTYVSDFFETNPPMILYFYMPVCLLRKIFHSLSIVYALKGYICFLVLCSLSVSYVLLERIFSHEKKFVYGLSAAFSFVLFFLFAHQFGQREHIFMIFILPYLLSLVLLLAHMPAYTRKCAESRSISILSRLVIAFFAAIGIALKPFFLFPIILIELYFIYHKRSLLALLRLENFLMVNFFLLYLSSIFIFHPNYFKLLFPLICNFYFIGFEESWLNVLVNYDFLYCLFAALVYFSFFLLQLKEPALDVYKINIHKHFPAIILLAMLGMVAAFVVPKMPWSYHVMPALSFALILLSYYLIAILPTINCNGSDIIMGLMIAFIFYYYPIYTTIYFYNIFINVKNHGDLYQLTRYFSRQPGRDSVTCLSTFTTTCFPFIYSSNSYQNEIGRFPFFWWTPGMLRWDMLPKDKLPAHIAKQKKFILQEFVKDFTHNRSTFVVMHTEDYNIRINPNFNYITYFSQNKKFRDEWRNYHLVKKVAFYEIYKRNAKE